jgi:hypothetical protein
MNKSESWRWRIITVYVLLTAFVGMAEAASTAPAPAPAQEKKEQKLAAVTLGMTESGGGGLDSHTYLPPALQLGVLGRYVTPEKIGGQAEFSYAYTGSYTRDHGGVTSKFRSSEIALDLCRWRARVLFKKG